MGKFSLKVSTDKSELSESTSGSGFIRNSGVYDVTVNFASIEETEKGAIQYNLNVTYNDNSTVLYGQTLYNIDGSENNIGMRSLNKLLIIAGLRNNSEPVMDVESHKVGKDQKAKEFQVITDCSDLDIKVQLKEEFRFYEGKVKRGLNIVTFFNAEGASADEIIEEEAGNEVALGGQLAKILANEGTTKHYSRAVGGQPAPTEEEIAAFIQSKSSAAGSKPAAKAAPVRKRFGNK